MKLAKLTLLPLLLILSACTTVFDFNHAITYFKVMDNPPTERVVNVKSRVPVFIHDIQYADQVVIQINSPETSENEPLTLFASQAFPDVHPGTISGAGHSLLRGMTNKVYCGRFPKGHELKASSVMVNLINCFEDIDEDGQFDRAYDGGVIFDPLTVLEVSKKFTTLENKIPYTKMDDNEATKIGTIYFRVDSGVRMPRKIEMFVKGESETISADSATFSEEQINAGTVLNIGGAEIRVLSTDGKMTEIELVKPISLDNRMSISQRIRY